jgi:hypothetical protein
VRPRARVHLSDSFAEQRLITKRMPIASETILPRNYGRGPGSIQFNMRASKTIGFGKVKATANSPERPRYGLVCTLQMRNLLNHNNPGPIIGNIVSPLFGKANQPAGSSTQSGTNFSESATNRRFELQLRFTFLKHCTRCDRESLRIEINRFTHPQREITRSRRSIQCRLKQWPRGPINYPDGLAYAPKPKKVFASDEHGGVDAVLAK